MKTKHIALITARGGSKGLPRKNILPVNGTPLIGWTIKAAIDCPYIDRVFVSTDDDEIAEVSRQFGAEIIARPDELASDTASSIDVIAHAIEWLEQRSIEHQWMTLLQPTSPLRTTQHLEEAIVLFQEKNAHFVISVFEPSHTPIKAYIERDNGCIEGLYSDDAPYTRRQDLPRAFQPNGAIYAFSVEEFKRNNHFPRTQVFPYIMSERDSADVDTLEDLMVVEHRLKEMNK
ncbi:cytidylyltransferase domain-containing protein [Vibrio natriegens]|uniref:acylneuraminate cytidylyltransferase family protein n=1 Tax=Vibrio natriegens TaxID=691 RepID=UPI000804421C|nr:acylneuraminate cytidylyltransferase family protein [Vibrio natriegens]ANQ15881.1 CMP-sialic acid synthetase [Vibrio natriegens]